MYGTSGHIPGPTGELHVCTAQHMELGARTSGQGCHWPLTVLLLLLLLLLLSACLYAHAISCCPHLRTHTHTHMYIPTSGNAHTGAARPYTRDGRQARNARVPDLLIARRKEGWKKTELSASSKLPAMQKVAETGRSVEVERLGASFALSGNPMAAEKSVPTMACRVHASAAGRLVCVVSCMLASVVGRATKASPEIPRAGRDGGGDSVDVGGSATINKGEWCCAVVCCCCAALMDGGVNWRLELTTLCSFGHTLHL